MDYPISVPGVGLVGGKFTDGNPLLSQPASLDPASWANAVTDELLNVISAAGITPDETQTNQLLLAIQKFAAQDYKNSARVVVTTAIALSGLPTVEGVPLAAGDRVLRALPAADVQNGLYVVAAGAWTRAVDADTSIEVTDSLLVAVEQGATNKDTLWQLVTDAPIVLGTKALLFEQVAGPTGVTAGFYSGVTVDKRGRVVGGTQGGEIQTITSSVAAGALTVGVPAGTRDFRSSTLGSGAINTRTFSALSLVVPSGASLGAVNAVAARLVLLEIDNAGTIELAVVNLAGGLNLDETTLINTTAISAGATVANVIYSTTARTGVPFRVVGFLDSTQAAAGTYATAPSAVQGVGGQALAALSSFGYGQTTQPVTRVAGTTYYNTTGKPFFLTPTFASTGAGIFTYTVTIGADVKTISIYGVSGGYYDARNWLVMPGQSYVLNTPTNCTISACTETK